MVSDDWLSTINLLGAAQGIFLAVLLASKHQNSVPNKILGAVMFLFSLDLLTAVYHAKGYDERFPHFIGWIYWLPFLFGPLLYFYVKTVSEGTRAVKRVDLLHFLPLLLVLALMVPFYFQSGTEKLAFLRRPEGSAWTPVLTLINHVKFVYGFVYLVVVVYLLRRHRARIKGLFSSVEHINLAWLRNLTIGLAAMWAVALALYVPALLQGMDPIEGYDDYAALAMTVLVYAIGYLGLRQQEIFAPRPLAPETATGVNGRADEEKPRYAKSGMTEAEAKQYKAQLLALMETEKPYRDSNLTLQDLADRLALSPHNLSEVINTQLGQNFYDFINGYRVDEVKQRLADPESAHFTLLAIGMEAGFNSKSSFNAVFKKHAHMTPSAYRKEVLAEV